jgi:DNA-binding CsgD family transcriptional regulator
MRISYYLDYILTEQQIAAKNITIESKQRQLAILRKERDRIIRQSSPSEVHAQSYDRPAIQNGYVLNEITQIEDLARITAEISDIEYALGIQTELRQELQDELADLRTIFQETEKRLANNREIKVFRLAREGKCNQEIADALGYEVRTIEQTKWQINLRIAEVSFNNQQQ